MDASVLLGPDVSGGADDPDPDALSGRSSQRARPAVRRSRGRRLESRAHRRAGVLAHAWSLTGDGFEIDADRRTAAMTA